MKTLALFLLAGASLWAGDEQEILATVQGTFDGMAAHDAARVSATLTPDARVLLANSEKILLNVTGEEFAQRVTAYKEEVLERMRNPKVQVRGRVASVWAEYEFLTGGKFSHCGIDGFQLVKTEAGWRIFSIVSTIEKEGCP